MSTTEPVTNVLTGPDTAALSLVDTLLLIVELRCPNAARHQRQVAWLTWHMAAAMGLSEREREILRLAALLHDVGKAVVPQEILLKPGPLTEVERDLVRTHTEVGYRILRTARFVSPIPEVALQHHERLDGSGYPQGLRGDEICPAARIVAVADVVEAMTNHRAYRPAMPLERALEEIRAGAGRLYDPQAVAACLSVCKQQASRLGLIKETRPGGGLPGRATIGEAI